MSCCPPNSAPYLAADHNDRGSVRSIDGISYYQVGSGPSGILYIPDVWGWNGGRTRAIVDDLAKKGLSCWVPKLLPPFEGGTDGDALPPDFSPVERGSELGPLFKGDWGKDKILPKLLTIVRAMKDAGVKKIGTIGICYGGWMAMHLANKIDLVGGASPHPSVHIEGMVGGDPAALGKGSKCPFALFPCGDASAGGDPDIYDEEGGLYKALEAKHKGKNVTKRYSSQIHGFFTRGAIKAGFKAGEGDAVKAAVEECMTDILTFFVRRGLLSRSKAELPPPPIKLKAPKWGKVEKIRPDARGLNLMLKCVKCEEKSTEKGKSWEAVLGDETGVVTFNLRSEELAGLCKVGNSLRVQNARVLVAGGHIRVIIDKWALMKAADAACDFDVKSDKDVSATEYELAH